jgi:CheY-like chemotaxis protein
MSHELRTPLNSILGFAQLLQRDKKTPLSERQQVRIQHVLRGGEHLLHLVDEVLDLARIEAGRLTISPEACVVSRILSEIESSLAPLAERYEVAVQVEPMAATMPPVIADHTRFQQVLLNFGSNALKYGKRGGHAVFQTAQRGEFVRVTVTDDGLGIPQDKQAAMFLPFQRAGQETGSIEGTGIGLAITKHLAELMHGRVGFNSVAGKGSAFWIELPVDRTGISSADLLSVAETPRPFCDAGGPRFRVVYVEDNPSSAALMQDLMAGVEQLELMIASSAERGLDLVREHQPHVVLMDVNLPGLNGIEAAQRLHECPETRHIPVIGLSAAAMVRDSELVKEGGFYRYLTKPLKIDELFQVLDDLLLRPSSVSPAHA